MRPMTAELGLVHSRSDPRFITSVCTSGASARNALAAPSSRRFSVMKCSTLPDPPSSEPCPGPLVPAAPAALALGLAIAIDMDDIGFAGGPEMPYLTCSFASRIRPITAELGLRHSANEPRASTEPCTVGCSARRFRAAMSSRRFSSMNLSMSSGVTPVPPLSPSRRAASSPALALGTRPVYFICSFASRIRPISAELGLMHSASDPRSSTAACTRGASDRRFRAAVSSRRLAPMKSSTSSASAFRLLGPACDGGSPIGPGGGGIPPAAPKPMRRFSGWPARAAAAPAAMAAWFKPGIARPMPRPALRAALRLAASAAAAADPKLPRPGLSVLPPYFMCSFASRMRPMTAELGLRHSAREPRSNTILWIVWCSARMFCAARSSSRFSWMNCSISVGKSSGSVD
mmetsp:Transcript_59946/g.170507  ORF Transcript_59946/g.170507 Transcript_59946/m.170507 type:complete len:403 (-) Transcript_59946:27-1235(-)